MSPVSTERLAASSPDTEVEDLGSLSVATGSINGPHRPVIDVKTIRVPAVGEVAPTPYLHIVDAENHEVELLTQGLLLLDEKAANTRESYAYALLRLCRFLWAVGGDPENLDKYHYRAYRRWLAHCAQMPKGSEVRRNDPGRSLDLTGRISGDTVSQAEAAARTVYSLLAEEDIIASCPVPAAAAMQRLRGLNPLEQPNFFGIRPGPGETGPAAKRPKHEITPLPPALQDMFLSDDCPRGAAMWRLMLESGPRINEALSLTPERIFLNENRAEVLGKGLAGGTRWIPLTDEFVDAYRAYVLDLAAHGVVLESGVSVWRSLRRPHGPVGYKAIYKVMKEMLGDDAARYAPHAMRHTAATAMLQEFGMSLEQVQRVLGHASLRSTQVYLHSSIAEATRQFTDAWRRGRTRPRLDVSDLYDPGLLNTLRKVLDDE